ncbi:MAG: TetR/AcrR family transcriptional regulator [Thermocrispum sp.]
MPAPSSTRITRKRTERIERLERTAARVFAERGYEGANFDQIAAELDLRGPSLYHYFSSKEELFLRCVSKAWNEVAERLHRIVDTDLAPDDKLYELFREQVVIEVRDYPEFVPLFFKTRLPEAHLAEQVLAIRRAHAALFEEIAEEIRRDTGTDHGLIRVWLATAFGALAYLPDWYDRAGTLTVDQLASTLADTLVRPFRSVTSGLVPDK